MVDCMQNNRSGRRSLGKMVVGSIDCVVTGVDEAGGYAGDAGADCSTNEEAAPDWNPGGLNWEALK